MLIKETIKKTISKTKHAISIAVLTLAIFFCALPAATCQAETSVTGGVQGDDEGNVQGCVAVTVTC